ncbi:MAG: hypothetical protein DWC07_00090 [Candidatus Poseidoniales archaeon]|nr:MAG: hypothetical protein DWC07_00090 [Candidatus Poseidoniales archaeon]
MSEPRTKLRLALEAAKAKLEGREVDHEADTVANPPPSTPPASKLNILLGTSHTPKERVPLFQRVGLAQRPTYDLLAERVLGPDVAAYEPKHSGYAEHVASRLRTLRGRWTSTEVQGQEEAESPVGWEADGRPVWRKILEEHRGVSRAHLAVEDGEIEPRVEAVVASPSFDTPSWPTSLTRSNHRTFKHWFVGEENFAATQTTEGVVDRPGGPLNPVLIHAEAQSGCSHLLHATGQALLRRQSGRVLRLSAADIVQRDSMEPMWEDAMADALAIVVDDLHEFASHDLWAHHLGVMVDQALNLGVQVILGGRISVDAMAPTRLKDVLRSSTVVQLRKPSVPTLLAYARWRASANNLLLHDLHLSRLVRHNGATWGSVDARLEQVTLALNKGEVLMEDDDVLTLIEQGTLGRPSPQPAAPSEAASVVAHRLVNQAVDHVFSDIDPGGIEVLSSSVDMGVDDYAPPEWSASDFVQRGNEEVNDRVQRTMERITPSMPSVLDVNERDMFLLNRHEHLRTDDIDRAVDMLVALEDSIDASMGASDAGVVESNSELHALENAMVELAHRAAEADIEELITIADELRVIEERLVVLDPDRAPLPAFAEDIDAAPTTEPPAKRRRFGRRQKKQQPVREDPLDSYTPDGEWNIQADGIEADALLEDDEPSLNVVRLARIHPVSSGIGEEE